MVMGNTPFTSAFSDEHGETRRPGYRLALLHPGKLIEPGDKYSIVIDQSGVPFLDRVLVTATLQARPVSPRPIPTPRHYQSPGQRRGGGGLQRWRGWCFCGCSGWAERV